MWPHAALKLLKALVASYYSRLSLVWRNERGWAACIPPCNSILQLASLYATQEWRHFISHRLLQELWKGMNNIHYASSKISCSLDWTANLLSCISYVSWCFIRSLHCFCLYCWLASFCRARSTVNLINILYAVWMLWILWLLIQSWSQCIHVLDVEGLLSRDS